MIDKAEIEAKAAEFEIPPSDVQRDYVFGWILFGLFTASTLKERIFLKGGNALRKGYFPETRFSSDLDLGIPDNITVETLLTDVNQTCALIEEKAGVRFVTENNRVKEKFGPNNAPLPDLKVYEARVYFKDFYGNADHITIKVVMDLTRFDRTLLPIQECELIHPYSDAGELACMIRCMKLEEIVATKLKCLIQRQHAPDLFDYVYAIRELGGELDRREIVDAFIRKTIFGRNPYVAKEMLVKMPWDFCRQLWAKAIVCAADTFLDVEDAISSFLQDLEDLFSPYGDNRYRSFVYFSADQRLPIMEAARAQTLLRMRYKGETRVVEPYALKYMQRKDGAEREYFYAYNVEGGSNPPGIRMFTADGVDSLENTDQAFEPRHTIELSKAGERPENPYLFDPNRPVRAARRRSLSSRGSIRYVYQCTHCGKQLTKASQSSTLRAHKRPDGSACYGRRGFYVTTKY